MQKSVNVFLACVYWLTVNFGRLRVTKCSDDARSPNKGIFVSYYIIRYHLAEKNEPTRMHLEARSTKGFVQDVRTLNLNSRYCLNIYESHRRCRGECVTINSMGRVGSSLFNGNARGSRVPGLMIIFLLLIDYLNFQLLFLIRLLWKG
jgi:hypothetical protein